MDTAASVSTDLDGGIGRDFEAAVQSKHPAADPGITEEQLLKLRIEEDARKARNGSHFSHSHNPFLK